MSGASGAERAGRVGLVLASLALAGALATGLATLQRLVAPGAFPGARAWSGPLPLGLLAALALALGACAAKRAGLALTAFAAIGWTLAVAVIGELPAAPSSLHFADGPALAPLYALLALGFGLYAAGLFGDHERETRAAVLLVLFTTANGKLLSRSGELAYPLIACAVLVAFGCFGRSLGFRDLLRRPARGVALPALAFVLWSLLAAAFADNVPRGFHVWMRVLSGALLAWTLAASLSPRGATRAAFALAVGAACTLPLLAAGLLESARYESWERIQGSRWRLFDMHPNGIGPQFGLGLVVSLALLGAAGKRGRALLVLLAAGSGLALARTESRASALGAVLGLGAVAWARFGPLPKRAWTLPALSLGLAAVGLALFASPIGAPVRAKLEASTHVVSAIGQRYHMWQMAYAAALDHPLVGVGPAQYYPHTRYAEPSYYDGTAQDLHAHDLFLALAEGGGWPALALFFGLLFAILELGRRALTTSDTRQRSVAAALIGALVATLGSNLLDLGQSQTTWVPLVLWISLGLLAALVGARDAAAVSDPVSRDLRAGVALALAVPLVVMPLVGLHYYYRGARQFEGTQLLAMAGRGRDAVQLAEDAESSFRTALLVNPAYSLVLHSLMPVLKATADTPEEHQRVLELQERITRGAPSRAKGWLALGELYLDHGKPRQGREAVEKAKELDPLGPDMGEYELAIARSWLLGGQVERARAALLEGLRLGGKGWRQLPQRELSPPDGAPSGARRVAFTAQGGESILLDELLETLVGDAIALGHADETRARRVLAWVIEGYRAQGRPDAALAALARYFEAVPERMEGLRVIQVQLLTELGRFDEARAVLEESGGVHSVAAAFVRGLVENGGPAELALAREQARALAEQEWGDIFFEAGARAWRADAHSRLALESGDFESALRHARAGVYDRSGAAERVAAAQRFFADAARVGVAREDLLRALDLVLHECSLDPLQAGRRAPMDRRAETLLRNWSGTRDELLSEAERRWSDLGAAGATFLEALRASGG